MFEGKPPAPSAYCGNQTIERGSAFADEQIFPLVWDDLMARLNAARDLRGVLSHVPDTARASFDAIAADHLAARRLSADTLNRAGSNGAGTNGAQLSKQAVNLVVSGNGKGDSAKEGSDAISACPAVRGIA